MNEKPIAENTVGSKQTKEKRHSENRHICAKTLSAIAASNKHPNEDRLSIDPQTAHQVLKNKVDHVMYKLWGQFRGFIPNAEREMSKTSLNENDVLPADIDKLAKPISEWTKIQVETGELTICVEVAVLEQAAKLAEARIRTVFMKRYWHYLQNGAELLKEADEGFEQMCAKLRLPRRTRAIMNRKKVNNEPVAEILNEN